MKYFFILLMMSNIFTDGYSQVNDNFLIKSVEYVEDKKRRDLYYDSNMNIVKENYYSKESQKIVNTIFYKNSKLSKILGYKKYPIIYFEIDIEKGTYKIPEEELELTFKDWFKFDGLQRQKGIVVNYKDGYKNGKLIQTDSGVIGKKVVVYQKVDPRFLRFNVVRFYNEMGTEDTYKLFKGLSLNFLNGDLNGSQSGYYSDGKIKFSSTFESGFVRSYNSYEQDGKFKSKIVTDSSLKLFKPYLYNGIVENKTGIKIANNELSKTGDIEIINDFNYSGGGWNDYTEFDYLKENHGEFLDYIKNLFDVARDNRSFPDFYDKYFTAKRDLKKRFDDNKFMVIGDNPHVIRVLFYIPKFYIVKYDFERMDQSDLIFY